MKWKIALILIFACITLLACENTTNIESENNEIVSEKLLNVRLEELTEDMIVAEYEAEDGTFSGNVKSESKASGYAGSGYVTGFHEEGDSCEITIEISKDGFYDFEFLLASESGYKENKVYLDEQAIGLVENEKKEFTSSYIKHIYIEKGKHTLSMAKFWGYVHWDKTIIYHSAELPDDFYEVNKSLVNQNATDNTKRLYAYLCDNYGERILSGQYCDTGMNGWEINVISQGTGGEAPAVLGLDFIDYSLSRQANGLEPTQTEMAEAYWNQGGIVTFCWHWNAPEEYLTGEWYRGFYTDSSNIDLEKVLNGDDPEGMEALLEDIDVIAGEIQKLNEKDVPILWRPLHEASGGWFWWGNAGAEAYKELYVLLYEKLTYEYECNNLIWIWNGQDEDWYPGDDYVDILGMDIYADKGDYSSQINAYLEVKSWSDEKKMVYLSENGVLFDPELAKRDGAMWGMFCTWQREFVLEEGLVKSYSEEYTSIEMLQKVYQSDYVITRSEIPELTTYPMDE